jgi:hypothetical protein
MKKLFVVAISLILSLSALNAQSIKGGSFYVGTRATGLDFSFSDKTDVDISAEAGYFLTDNLSIGGEVGIQSYDSNTGFRLMANASYYFLETSSGALFGRFGMGVDQEMGGKSSLAVDMTAGYSIFITDKIAVEPTAGFFIPLKDDRNASFNLGFGFSLYF